MLCSRLNYLLALTLLLAACASSGNHHSTAPTIDDGYVQDDYHSGQPEPLSTAHGITHVDYGQCSPVPVAPFIEQFYRDTAQLTSNVPVVPFIRCEIDPRYEGFKVNGRFFPSATPNADLIVYRQGFERVITHELYHYACHALYGTHCDCANVGPKGEHNLNLECEPWS